MERKDELHQMLTALCFGLALLNSTAQAQNNNHQHGNNSYKQTAAKAVTQHGDLKETQVLQQHDDLMPTLNRTSAMRYEAEDGHLWPGADEKIKPKPQPIKQSPLHNVDPSHIHVPHQLTQTYR